MKIIFIDALLFSYNMKERVDSKKTVYDNSNQETIKSDFDNWSKNIFK